METLKQKLGSRKLWVLVGAVISYLLGFDIPPELFGVIASYILGQAVVDAAAAKRPSITVAAVPTVRAGPADLRDLGADLPAPTWDNPPR